MFGQKAARILDLERQLEVKRCVETTLRDQLTTSKNQYERVYKQYQDGLKKLAEETSQNYQIVGKEMANSEARYQLEVSLSEAKIFSETLREQHQDLQNRYDLLEALLKQLNVPVKLPVRKTTK